MCVCILCMCVCVCVWDERRQGVGSSTRAVTRRTSYDDDMAQDFPFIRHFIHSLAVHHGGSPGVASSRHRFTLSLALPFHPIDYVRHQLLLLLPLLFPVWPLPDLSGHVSQFSPLLSRPNDPERLIDERGGGRVAGGDSSKRGRVTHAGWG